MVLTLGRMTGVARERGWVAAGTPHPCYIVIDPAGATAALWIVRAMDAVCLSTRDDGWQSEPYVAHERKTALRVRRRFATGQATEAPTLCANAASTCAPPPVYPSRFSYKQRPTEIRWAPAVCRAAPGWAPVCSGTVLFLVLLIPASRAKACTGGLPWRTFSGLRSDQKGSADG